MDYETTVYTNIGKNIRKYRLAQGFSQEKLAEMLGANSKFIGHVERYERCISLKKLIQLSQILSVDLPALVSADD